MRVMLVLIDNSQDSLDTRRVNDALVGVAAGRPMVCPVSPATTWLLGVSRDITVQNIETILRNVVDSDTRMLVLGSTIGPAGRIRIRETVGIPLAAVNELLDMSERDEEGNAFEKALDDIATLSGIPDWQYPGQVVRDVLALVKDAVLADRNGRLEELVSKRLGSAGMSTALASLATPAPQLGERERRLRSPDGNTTAWYQPRTTPPPQPVLVLHGRVPGLAIHRDGTWFNVAPGTPQHDVEVGAPDLWAPVGWPTHTSTSS